MRKYYIAALVGIFVVLAAIGASYAVTAGVRYDRQAEDDLAAIQESVKEYYREHKKLPLSANETNLEKQIKDRAVKRKYEYRELSHFGLFGDDKYFEVCAEFKTDTKESNASYYEYPKYHDIGRNCYTTKVN